MRVLAVSKQTVAVEPLRPPAERAVAGLGILLARCLVRRQLLRDAAVRCVGPDHTGLSRSQRYLIAARQRRRRRPGGLTLHRFDLMVPAHLVRPGLCLVQLEPLLAAAVGHPAVQGHVAVIRLCGLVNGQLGLFGSGGRQDGGTMKGEIKPNRSTNQQMGVQKWFKQQQ